MQRVGAPNLLLFKGQLYSLIKSTHPTGPGEKMLTYTLYSKCQLTYSSALTKLLKTQEGREKRTGRQREKERT